MEIDCHAPTKRPYAQSSALRRRLEVGTVLLTCLGAGIEPAYDKVDRLKTPTGFSPRFRPARRGRQSDERRQLCRFGHWGNHAYLLQYVSRQNPGFFMNNELSHLYNLASVFSERLDTPQALLLAGESYRSFMKCSPTRPIGTEREKGLYRLQPGISPAWYSGVPGFL